MDRPNIVICMVDQLRAQTVGCYGNEAIRTPHLDRLASQGMRFHTAISNNPVCTPARSCLLTGQYSRTCTGCLGNVAAEPPTRNRRRLPDITLPEVLREHGYQNTLIGKWHIDPHPLTVGFDKAVWPLTGHRNYGQHFYHCSSLDEQDSAQPANTLTPEYEMRQVTDFFRGEHQNPFFLFYNITQPHMPLADIPTPYLQMYEPDNLPLRENVIVHNKPAYDEHWFRIYLHGHRYYKDKEPDTELPDGFDIRNLTAYYYAAVTWMDEQVGHLLDCIEQSGLADNTLVIFLSDHGDNLGSHHLFNKDVILEESIRIPMIFRFPGKIDQRVNENHLAQTIDIMPTVLDMLELPMPGSVQGRSVKPILTGLCCELEDNVAFIETDTRQIAIRTADSIYGALLAHDLRQVENDQLCFYNVAQDPLQQHNLLETAPPIPDQAHHLRECLLQWHENTPWLSL